MQIAKLQNNMLLYHWNGQINTVGKDFFIIFFFTVYTSYFNTWHICHIWKKDVLTWFTLTTV